MPFDLHRSRCWMWWWEKQSKWRKILAQNRYTDGMQRTSNYDNDTMTHPHNHIAEPFDTGRHHRSLPFAPIINKRVIQLRSAVYFIPMRRSFFYWHFCATWKEKKVLMWLPFRMWIRFSYSFIKVSGGKNSFLDLWYIIVFCVNYVVFSAFILVLSDTRTVDSEKVKAVNWYTWRYHNAIAW